MKLSVALCTFNGQAFLERQLNSILNQTRKIDEIIVCDDSSSDLTVSILNKYASNYPDIFKIFVNDQNLNVSKNFEKAMMLCHGDYIFLADQDDLWKTDKVAKILKVFEQNPTAEGVFSNADLIDDNDNLLTPELTLWDTVRFLEKESQKPIDLFKLLVIKGNYVTGATLCIKKEVLDFCVPFKIIDKIFLHDEWLAFVLSHRKTLFYSTEKLISYRIHSSQQIGVGRVKNNPEKFKKEVARSLNMLFGITAPKRFNDYKVLAKNHKYQYEKYNKLFDGDKEMRKLTAEPLLPLYLDADSKMKKANVLLYMLRKWNNKIKRKN
jgi:glycosyltransferase involved in cell wall biosynthesis